MINAKVETNFQPIISVFDKMMAKLIKKKQKGMTLFKLKSGFRHILEKES